MKKYKSLLYLWEKEEKTKPKEATSVKKTETPKEVKKEEIKTIKTKKEPVEHLSNEQVKRKLTKEIKEVEGTYTP